VLVLGSIYPSGGQAGRVVDPAGAYPALRAGDKTGMQPVALCGAGARLRRLTPRECERLQGFPDDWTRWGATPDGRTVEISDTRRYRLLGNAVTVSVVEYLGGLLRGCLQ
jgi:DNA (cytosine-5)-methyltransferase 1